MVSSLKKKENLSKIGRLCSLAISCGTGFLSPLSAEEAIQQKTIDMEMCDGFTLPTDFYYIGEEANQLPCILLRSPSGRHSEWARACIPLAQQGYLLAIQETRSSIHPEGKTLPYVADNWINEKDGHTTLEWLAKSSMTNGKVGTLGFSALGITQLLMAPYAPESLKCQYIGTAPASLYHHAIFPSGVLLEHQVAGWLGYFAKDSGVYSFVSNQRINDRFWQGFDSRTVAEAVKAPAIHQAGWFDTFLQGSIDAFQSRQLHGGEGACGHQKLIIGPWLHFWPKTTQLGDFEVPEAGRTIPFQISPLNWFDFYLKGISNGIDQVPAVIYYVMGPFDGSPSKGNLWKNSPKWPVDATTTPYYLGSDSNLSTNAASKALRLSYHQDPWNPVQTLGGLNLFLKAGPVDQSPIESRKDLLLFTSSPLEADLEVTGPIVVKLFVSPHLPGRTVAVRLCDLYPDGRSILICDGIHRWDTDLIPKEPLGNGDQPSEIEVNLWATSMVFAKGHRLRVSIAGSNYPRYEKSRLKEAVENHIYVGGDYPSRILLPIVD